MSFQKSSEKNFVWAGTKDTAEICCNNLEHIMTDKGYGQPLPTAAEKLVLHKAAVKFLEAKELLESLKP